MTNFSQMPSSELITLMKRQQAALGLGDEAIADALSYSDPGVIRMIKGGQMRLPINKAFALAKVLEVEPGDVMRLVLKEMDPSILESVETCMGPLALSPGERRLLIALRRCARGKEIAPLFIEGAPVVAVIVGN